MMFVRPLRWMSLLCVLVGSIAVAPNAYARSMVIEEMHADLRITDDSILEVEETLRIRFQGSYQGIFRTIPYAFRREMFGLKLFRDSISILVTDVKGEDGNQLEFWEERSAARGRMRLKIRVPGANSSERTIRIRYVVKRAIRTYSTADEDYGRRDELRWNVTGNDTDFPIRKASATVYLPKGVQRDDVSVVGFTGVERSVGKDYTHAWRDAHTVHFETTRVLGANEGLTIGTFFPSGIVKHPGVMERMFGLFLANWFLLLPLLLLLRSLRKWWTRGRDSLAGRTIIPEYDPPGDLRAAEVGLLADDKIHPRDITAAIVDLAVRGHLQLRAGASGKSEDMEVRVIPNPEGRDELRSWEKTLVDGFSNYGANDKFFTLSSLRRRFSSKIRQVEQGLVKGMVKENYYPKAPAEVVGAAVGGSILLLIAAVILGILLKWSLLYFIMFVPVGVCMLWIARHMSQRTKKGLDALARIKGMEEYLETAEQDRMERMPLHDLERLLPYAISLGLHDKWIKHIQPLYDQAPDWYDTRGRNWNDVTLRSSFRGLHFSVGDSLYAAPRVQSTSTSSGGWSRSWGSGTGSSGGSSWSGGGGSSGGGFGGGGVGGW